MRGWFLGSLAVSLLLGGALDAQPQDAKGPEPGETVPFELMSDFLVVVNGQVGALEGLKFILDTGATYTVIDRRVAEKLGLHREPGKVMNFNREVPVEWAEIPGLQVGPIRSGASRVLVGKLSDYSTFGEKVDGIIGLDLLSKSKKLMIDYETRAVWWQLSERETNSGPTWNYYIMPVVVQGHAVRLIVDTGMQGILLYGDRIRRSLPTLRTEGEKTRVGFGHLQTTQVKLPGVRIAGPETVATVFMMDGPGGEALPGVDGYLGVASLHAKRVEFDFEAMKIRWQ
jgi:predicted aspartyl protease